MKLLSQLKPTQTTKKEVTAMSKHSIQTMKRCGELRLQGWTYRDIQQYVGNSIGRKTVKRYANAYIEMLYQMRRQILAITRDPESYY